MDNLQENEKKQVKRASASHHGRFPFSSPEEKKPLLLTKKDALSRTYGEPAHQIASYTYLSTNRIHISQFSVLPGQYFVPAGIHGGDESYFMLEGELTILNPEIGSMCTAKKGDVVLIPKGSMHQPYNFSNGTGTLLCAIAPHVKYDEEDEKVIEQDTKDNLVYSNWGHGNINMLGHWPIPGPAARKKKEIIMTRSDESLHIIRGGENPVLWTFGVSNDFIHMGKITVPGDSISDEEIHQGDEVIFPLTGPVSILGGENEKGLPFGARFEVSEGEGFFIPEGTRHRYRNFSNMAVTVCFAIAPGL